jgi:hypothetical protein
MSEMQPNSMVKPTAILMWTMHDLPTYGLVAGCATKGYQGCPCCGPHIVITLLKSWSKHFASDLE